MCRQSRVSFSGAANSDPAKYGEFSGVPKIEGISTRVGGGQRGGRESAERESLVRQRSVLVHDVHRAAFDGQRNAQLRGHGFERVVEALQIGARSVLRDAENQPVGRSARNVETVEPTGDRRGKGRSERRRRARAASESSTGGSLRSPNARRR